MWYSYYVKHYILINIVCTPINSDPVRHTRWHTRSGTHIACPSKGLGHLADSWGTYGKSLDEEQIESKKKTQEEEEKINSKTTVHADFDSSVTEFIRLGDDGKMHCPNSGCLYLTEYVTFMWRMKEKHNGPETPDEVNKIW